MLSDGGRLPILTMGPICIRHGFRGKGYGKFLLDYSLEAAADAGFGALCFEGDIGFYGRSGFRYASDFSIRYHGLSAEDDSSFFLARELFYGYLNGIDGEYRTPDIYTVCETEAEAFDSLFPHKEKLRLPTQIF